MIPKLTKKSIQTVVINYDGNQHFLLFYKNPKVSSKWSEILENQLILNKELFSAEIKTGVIKYSEDKIATILFFECMNESDFNLYKTQLNPIVRKILQTFRTNFSEKKKEITISYHEFKRKLENIIFNNGKIQIKKKKVQKHYELTDISGVGDLTFEKLKKVGITSVRALAILPPEKVMDEAGIGEKTAIKIIKLAQDIEHMGSKSADEIWEERKTAMKLTTGSHCLDELLAGGFEAGALFEIFGEHRTGKTQLAHQMSVNVQLPFEEGGLEGGAYYLDTEGTFRAERIIQLSEVKELDYHEILKNITVGQAFNSDFQSSLMNDVILCIREKNIKLIVVDSLTKHFHNEYPSRYSHNGSDLLNPKGEKLLNSHMNDLARLSILYPDLVIITTNRVTARPDVFYGNPITHIGGHIVAHNSTIRIYLRKGKGEARVAKVVDAPHLPEQDAVFKITEDGIGD